MESGEDQSVGSGDRTHARMQLTDWSLVSRAGGTDSPEVREALQRLCKAYWNPIYAYIRAFPRYRFSAHDAEDLTQGFIAHLLEKGAIHKADRSKGRFRSFLLGSLNYFIKDHLEKIHAAKRGGKYAHVSLDDPDTPESDRNPLTEATPETIFCQQWVNTLIERALQPLRADYTAKGRSAELTLLEPFVLREEADQPYSSLAQRLGKSEGAVATEICRLRERYVRHFREEVARTVSTIAEVDDEIRAMTGAFRK